jgi:hypothetical protein
VSHAQVTVKAISGDKLPRAAGRVATSSNVYTTSGEVEAPVAAFGSLALSVTDKALAASAPESMQLAQNKGTRGASRGTTMPAFEPQDVGKGVGYQKKVQVASVGLNNRPSNSFSMSERGDGPHAVSRAGEAVSAAMSSKDYDKDAIPKKKKKEGKGGYADSGYGVNADNFDWNSGFERSTYGRGAHNAKHGKLLPLVQDPKAQPAAPAGVEGAGPKLLPLLTPPAAPATAAAQVTPQYAHSGGPHLLPLLQGGAPGAAGQAAAAGGQQEQMQKVAMQESQVAVVEQGRKQEVVVEQQEGSAVSTAPAEETGPFDPFAPTAAYDP